MSRKAAIEHLYDFVTGDEDARVCKDIPAAACADQPRNFFAYLGANLLTKVADELSSARLVLPWLLGAAGAPAAFAGFLVPIREAGVLLPQMFVAVYVRGRALRKGVWLAGALASAIALVLMATAALGLGGAAAGWAVIGTLTVFSLARGLCSVAAKDVMGKTISKSRRGTLMGYAAGAAGVLTLLLGLYLELFSGSTPASELVFAMLLAGAVLWLAAAALFAAIREQPGATEGGGNALAVALAHLNLLRSDRPFRAFVAGRILLMAVALTPPFFVLLAQRHARGGLAGLGMMIIASGLAGSLSAPLWGRLGDRSSRRVMALAATGAGALSLLVWLLVLLELSVLQYPLTWAALFLLLSVAHSGVRLGRKVYLVDMATAQTRAAYVAVSNSVIGVAMLAAGSIGVLGDALGTAAVILGLGILSLAAAAFALRLPEVSD